MEQQTVQPVPSSGSSGKRSRGRPFKKGQSGNPEGKKKKVLEPPPGLLVLESETELEAMQCLLLDPEPKTKLQWQMKQLLLGNRDKFYDRKQFLEKMVGPQSAQVPDLSSSATSATPATGVSAPLTPDLSSRECVRLAEEMLERLGKKYQRPSQSPTT